MVDRRIQQDLSGGTFAGLPRVVSIGLAAQETIAMSPGGWPDTGASIRIPEQVKTVAGGMAVNFARACKIWGTHHSLITRAGTHLANYLRKKEEFGETVFLCPCDCSAAPCRCRPRPESATCVTLVHPTVERGIERSFLLFPGRKMSVTISDLNLPDVTSILKRADHVHFAGVGDGSDSADPADTMCCDAPEFRTFLAQLRKVAKTVSMDFAPAHSRLQSKAWREAIYEKIAFATFVMPSDFEAYYLMESDPKPPNQVAMTPQLVEDLADALKRLCPNSFVIVKSNAQGCYSPDLDDITNDGWVTAERGVRIKDPTGAGDIFCAAFLTAWLTISRYIDEHDAHLVLDWNCSGSDHRRRNELVEFLITYAGVCGNAGAAETLARVGGGRDLPSWMDLLRHRVVHHPQMKAQVAKAGFAQEAVQKLNSLFANSLGPDRA